MVTGYEQTTSTAYPFYFNRLPVFSSILYTSELNNQDFIAHRQEYKHCFALVINSQKPVEKEDSKCNLKKN